MSTSLSSAALQSIRFSRELNDDVTRLRDMAAGILRRPGVRAVVIDRRELRDRLAELLTLLTRQASVRSAA